MVMKFLSLILPFVSNLSFKKIFFYTLDPDPQHCLKVKSFRLSLILAQLSHLYKLGAFFHSMFEFDILRGEVGDDTMQVSLRPLAEVMDQQSFHTQSHASWGAKMYPATTVFWTFLD